MRDEAQELLDGLAALPSGTVGCGTCALQEECSQCTVLDMREDKPKKSRGLPDYMEMELLFCSAYTPEPTTTPRKKKRSAPGGGREETT